MITTPGTGQVAGIMRNHGRYAATEEMIVMGAGDLFVLTDRDARHSYRLIYQANLRDPK